MAEGAVQRLLSRETEAASLRCTMFGAPQPLLVILVQSSEYPKEFALYIFESDKNVLQSVVPILDTTLLRLEGELSSSRAYITGALLAIDALVCTVLSCQTQTLQMVGKSLEEAQSFTSALSAAVVTASTPCTRDPHARARVLQLQLRQP